MAEVLDLDQLKSEAQNAYFAADFLEAAEMYKAARNGYQARGDFSDAAQMANNSSVSYLRGKNASRALSILEGVDHYFEATGDFRGEAITAGNRAAALEALGRKDESAENYQKAADIFKRIGDDEMYTITMQSLSTLQLRKGRSLAAIATMQAGINQIENPKIIHRILKKLLNIPSQWMNR
jgi:tetratricopeptide (TPR) repeat protein